MQPIVETLSTGISESANQRITDNISKAGCRNKVLAWVATSVPDDTAAKLTMELMEKWQKEDGK
jgi:hypothetical protein